MAKCSAVSKSALRLVRSGVFVLKIERIEVESARAVVVDGRPRMACRAVSVPAVRAELIEEMLT
jgi:hypothetical protein